MSDKQLQFYDSNDMSIAKTWSYLFGFLSGLGSLIFIQTCVYYYLKTQGLINTWFLP